MIGRSVILLCIAAIFVAIESKPLHSQYKSIHKNDDRSILQLKLSKADIKRGISIQISSKRHRNDMAYVHRVPVSMEQRRNRVKSVMMRNKRSVENDDVANKKIVANQQKMQIKNFHKFNEDNTESNDYNSFEEQKPTRVNLRHGSARFMQEDEQQKQLKFINSADYRDYAFDTTDNVQYNEDDDLLQRYYNTKPVRRAISNDYGSFTDLMRVSATENENNDRNIRQLHYGNDDHFMNNDHGEKGSNEDDQEIYDEYDNYDDEDY